MSFGDVMKTIGAALQYELFELAGTPVTLMTVVMVGLVLIATLVISKLVRKAVGAFLERRQVRDEGTRAVIGRLLHYVILFTGLAIGLDTLGINLSALFAAGALFAVAIGFAMQNVTANFVSGVILMIERSIKPGDILEVEGSMVRAREMGIRSTIVRTLDDEDVIIPNSTLVQSSVKNFTLRDPLHRLRVMVGVEYGEDMKLVMETLRATAAGVPWATKRKQPVVLMSEFGSSSVDFEVSVWTEDPWSSRRQRSELRQAIWWALKDAGVTIAFPQLDVHFDEGTWPAGGSGGVH